MPDARLSVYGYCGGSDGDRGGGDNGDRIGGDDADKSAL